MSPLTSFLIAALGLLAVQVAGRRSPILTLITLVTLLGLPLLSYLPKVHLPLPEATTNLVASTPPNLFLQGYLLGLALFAGKLLLDLRSFSSWRKKSVNLPACRAEILATLAEAKAQLGYQKDVALRLHRNLSSPVAAGLFRPTIYLPDSALSWSTETLRCVLLHELGHHVRRDLWTALSARLACVLHWFNPLAWMLRRQLLAQCEFACDARVLATGLDATRYAHTLCDLALPNGTRAPALSLAMATKSSLRDRVENLVTPRRPLTILPIAATLLLTVGTALALSTLRPALERTFPLSLSPDAEAELRLSANPFPGN